MSPWWCGITKAGPWDRSPRTIFGSSTYALKVLVSAGGENFGRLEQPLAVDGFDGKQLALSGLALSKQIRPASISGPGEDMQLMEGVAPLIYQNMRLLPSGDAWFRKGEKAAIYGEAYEPVPPAGNPAPVEIRLSVTDLATGKSTPAGSARLDAFRPGSFAVIPFALNLTSLLPGHYRAEVEAVGQAGLSVRRSLSFEVR